MNRSHQLFVQIEPRNLWSRSRFFTVRLVREKKEEEGREGKRKERKQKKKENFKLDKHKRWFINVCR